ncbi:MAG: ribonuclease III [Bryobacterales bacterium]|nr:ribonuclease III [Bryobacterales bacterium]
MTESLTVLEDRVGYSFQNKELLQRALTHKSRAFEAAAHGAERQDDNEQLEFLGDSILGFIVSEVLVSRYPTYPEGRLSKLKAYLVSANHLHEVAADLGVGAHLLLGRGEELSGGRAKRALLANALEALIAALYLDAGIEAVRRFVLHQVVGDFDAEKAGDEALAVDYKSALQEAAQQLGLPMPRYAIAKESGPEHSKTFTVEVRVGHQFAERAEGTSKKAAGQRAAQMVLAAILAANDGDVGLDSAQHPPAPELPQE